MAIFELKYEHEQKQARTRLDFLCDQESRIELTQKRKQASRTQKNYGELLFTWFAMEYGETREYVKQIIFKQQINADIFKAEHTNKQGVTRIAWRSVNDLDSKETTIAYERLRNWSSKECGIYLPEPNEKEFLDHIEAEARKYENKRYL